MERRDLDTPPDDHGSAAREAAPPIEREHETYAGIFEEDERRRQREEDERHERERQ